MSSVEKRIRNGRTRYRARWRDNDGKQRAKTFDRKIDAQQHLASVDVSLAVGDYVDPRAGRVTFAIYYTDWASRQLWNPRTVKAMDLAAHSVPFADQPLRSISRSHVESWIKEMTSRLAPGTIRTRVANVRQVFRAAVRDRVIRHDPTDGVSLPRRPRREATMRILSNEQTTTLLTACSDKFRPFVAVGIFAGLRLGEVAGLQVGDIDFLRKTLVVRRQVQRAPGGGVTLDPPKSRASERSVPIPASLVTILAAHVSALPDNDPSRFLFTTSGGQPTDQNVAGTTFRRAAHRAGLDAVTFHDLRHTYASALIAGGADVVSVQHALGHSSPTVTLNTYAHLWPNADDRTRQIAEAFAIGVLDQVCTPGVPAHGL